MIDLATIRDALARGEFFLEYLPAVSLAGGRCTGAEALIRWRSPAGIVSPAQFIPVVEQTPVSGLLTYWVMEPVPPALRVMDTVHAELGDWLRANPEAYVGINVPPEVLGRGGLAYSATKSG